MDLHFKIPTFLHKLGQSVFCNLGVRVPIKVSKGVLLVECLTSNAFPLDIALSLMLFDAQALDMEPLRAFVLALDHQRVLVRHSVPTDTVFFGVVNLDQFSRYLS